MALDLAGLAVEADHPRHPLDLPRRQPEGLAEVAHRAPRTVGGEGGDQRRAVGAVAAVDLGDQDLADVAGEVEVDVGHRGDLLVEEAGDEEVGLDRVDVGEPGQEADDRADARAPPPPRRQHRPGRARPPHPHRHLARQLEQVAVQEEEPGEAEVADHPQLLLQPALGLAPIGGARIAVVEPGPADLGQVAVGAVVLGARVAVAELGGEVEAQPLGEPHRLRHRLGVLGEAARHPLRRGESGARVSAPQRLGLLQPGAAADGDERVLEASAGAAVAVDVPAGDAGHPQPLRQPRQPAVAGAVVALVGPLQLDPQALGPEGLEQLGAERPRPRPLAALAAARQHPVAGAAGEADEALGALLHPLQLHPRLAGPALGAVAGVGVGGGEEAAEVPVAGGGLDQQGQVGEVGLARGRRSASNCPKRDRQLGAGDRPHPQPAAGVGELHRPPDAVVVGEGDRRVVERGGGGGELGRRRGAVEEGEGGVSVELDVGGSHLAAHAAWRCQRPVRMSRKTVALRPSARTSS